MSEDVKMVTLTIDGKEATVPAGTNILEAAKTVGFRIPNFCYHPDLTWEGSCRMCLVTIEGRPKLTPSCCEPVADGMEVKIASEIAEDARRAQLEFLLINHPLDCPICDQAGECKLQDYYVEHGRYMSRMPRRLKVHKKKVVDLGDRIVLDKERCVLCSRCVRFTREVSGSHALQFFTRGVTTEIGTPNDEPITGDDYIGNVVDICPVGALTSKDFRFAKRVWFLKSAESVCGHCSTGCNIRMDHRDGRIFRFVPRRNPQVNKSWICDAGRDSYKHLQGDDRLTKPLVRDAGSLEAVGWEDAMLAAKSAIEAAKAGGPNAIAAIASPRGTTETLYQFKRFANEVLGTRRIDFRVDGSHEKTTELADQILRRRDPHPNNTGCKMLGLDRFETVESILDACEKGEIKLLHLIGTDLLKRHPNPERVRAALTRVEHVILHATHEVDHLSLASIVLPGVPHSEIEGTFVNYQGRVQRFERAFPARPRARAAARVLADLAAYFDVELPRGSADAIFDEMSRNEPAFGGIQFKEIGRHGVVVGVAETAGASGS